MLPVSEMEDWGRKVMDEGQYKVMCDTSSTVLRKLEGKLEMNSEMNMTTDTVSVRSGNEVYVQEEGEKNLRRGQAGSSSCDEIRTVSEPEKKRGNKRVMEDIAVTLIKIKRCCGGEVVEELLNSLRDPHLSLPLVNSTLKTVADCQAVCEEIVLRQVRSWRDKECD